MTERHVHLQVRGRVQGVGFRHFVRERARRLGVRGWVRNLPDGAVELEAAGDPDAIDRFERAVREGPPGSRVEDVRTVDGGTGAPLDSPFAIVA